MSYLAITTWTTVELILMHLTNCKVKLGYTHFIFLMGKYQPPVTVVTLPTAGNRNAVVMSLTIITHGSVYVSSNMIYFKYKESKHDNLVPDFRFVYFVLVKNDSHYIPPFFLLVTGIRFKNIQGYWRVPILAKVPTCHLLLLFSENMHLCALVNFFISS
jgi:hypothetical protein